VLPDLVSLALFVRVAELRSITKAAQASHIAVAAASRRISLLEQQCGLKLLERTSRGVELTAAGKAVLHRARQILNQVDQVHADLAEHASGGRGHVRIQASASAISQFLPMDLAKFSARVPQAAIALEERFSGEIAQAVREGVADIGVIMEGTPVQDLQCFDYKVDRLVAVIPRAHPVRGRSIVFSSLLDYEFVGLEGATAITRLLTDQASVSKKPMRTRIQVHSFAALCKMIEAGFGVGVLPEGAARSFIASMRLRMVRLADEWARRQMHICVRDYALLSPVAQKLVDHLRQGTIA